MYINVKGQIKNWSATVTHIAIYFSNQQPHGNWQNDNTSIVDTYMSMLTSVFIPKANDAAAATIKMIRVKSCQASQRNICKHNAYKWTAVTD